METDSFETDLRQALSRRAAEVPVEAIERLRHQHYRPRTAGRARIAGVGLVGAAAVVLATTVAYSGSTPDSHPNSAPDSRPAKAQLADWTVTRQADGTVHIAIRELGDLAGLQSKLRAAGVPASVSTAGNPVCVRYPLSATQSRLVLKFPNSQALYLGPSHLPFVRGASTLTIHESAMPSGMGVEIIAYGDRVAVIRLVRASQECTGS
jgi:hypothetical protein